MKVAHWKMAQDWINHPEPKNSRGVWDDLVKVANAEWRNKERALMAVADSKPYAGVPEEWDDLTPREEQYYQQGPFSTDEVFLGSKGGVPQLVQPGPGRPGYKGEALTERPFDVTKINLSEYEKKLIRDEFPELEFKFNKKQPIGIKAYKNHMNYKRVKDFIQRDFKTTVAFEPLSLGAQREVMREFTLPKGMKWNFEKYRYGISDGRAKGEGKYGGPQRVHEGTVHKGSRSLVRKIANFVSDPTKSETRYWGRKNTPGGFMLSSVDRAVLQGNKNYKLKIKDGRVIGFVDKTVLDKNGNPIEFLYKGHGEERLKPGQKLITSHPQFKKIEKFYDVAFEATKSLDDTSRVFQKLFEGKGFNTANIRFTDLVRFLVDETTKGAVENAISKHHKKGVGTSPLKDLQIVTQVNNQFADDMAKKIRLGKLTVEDLEAINKRGVRFQVDGKWYGKDTGSTPKEQYKKVVSETIGDVKKWKPEKFKQFKIHVDKQLPKIIKAYQANGIGNNCKLKKGKAEGGRIGFDDGGFNNCMSNAIQEHNNKLQSDNLAVRNEARAKQFKINQTKGLKNILGVGRRGLQGVAGFIGGWGGAAIEAVAEGAFYEHARRQGYNHKQAMAETFLPKVFDKNRETGVWEGAENLLADELVGKRDEEGYLKSATPHQETWFNVPAAEYQDNLKALENIQGEIGNIQMELNAMKANPGYVTPEQLSAKEQELEAALTQGESIANTLKVGTPEQEAYVRAEEKQKALQDERAQKHWGDTRAYKKGKERQWQEEFLDYRGADRKYRKDQPFAFKDQAIESSIVDLGSGERINWDAYKNYGWDKPEQKWKDLYDMGGWDLMDRIGIAGGVSKMSQGGRVSYLDGGIVSLLKKK